MGLITLIYISVLEIKDGDVPCQLKCDPGFCVKENVKEKCICPTSTHKFLNESCIGKFYDYISDKRA